MKEHALVILDFQHTPDNVVCYQCYELAALLHWQWSGSFTLLPYPYHKIKNQPTASYINKTSLYSHYLKWIFFCILFYLQFIAGNNFHQSNSKSIKFSIYDDYRQVN